ncbi:SWIM zinc finger family protein [Streptomyces synnematoformans]|uniref:SWIM zinc finger family protein n=1 Tax=Streptomyces synnematoformans TaxID=415721 RepID=A0ABN2XU50_9ACTN
MHLNDGMQMAMPSEKSLLRLAGSRSYARGEGYVDAVDRLRVDEEGTVTARVSGTDVYQVTLWLGAFGTDGAEGEDADFDGACDCPYGQEGHFCKHCVAVGLALIHGARARRVPAPRTDDVLDQWLQARDRGKLLALVRERIAQDGAWREALALRAELAQAVRGGSGEGAGAAAGLRERILGLVDAQEFSRYGYVEYADAHAYGDRIAEAAAGLAELTEAGRADRAVALAREAIEAAVGAYDAVDDSSGHVGGAIDELAAAHAAACAVTRPDPIETARWLTARMLGDDYGTPEWDLADYRDALGAAGLAEVRRLADQAHAADPSGWAPRALLESLHRAEGDVDALVALYAVDLAPGGWSHVRIARVLDEAGRRGEALDWAERGLRATAGERHVHHELLDYLTRRYTQAGRHTDAAALRRDRFHTELTLDTWRGLRTAAAAAGCWDGPDGDRATALAALRAAARTTREEAADGRTAAAAGVASAGSALIDVLIDEGELDEAWHAAENLASRAQWLALADASARARPADAARAYLREVDERKRHTGDANYHEIATLLDKARACHQRTGTTGDFSRYTERLRTEQKRKRNLMRILDQHGL